jgi:hypothetical protein
LVTTRLAHFEKFAIAMLTPGVTHLMKYRAHFAPKG